MPRRLDPPHAAAAVMEDDRETADAEGSDARRGVGVEGGEEETGEAGTGFEAAKAKAKTLPQTPGVYLFKDAAGRVIYVGKAVNLRSRVGSYFLKAAAQERRTAELVTQIADVDHVDCPDEVEALLTEARLIKDIRPRFNSDLKDDKTFPYLQITRREDFPRVEFTREPNAKNVKLYGPFPSAGKLRGVINALQKVFKFRTCALDIDAEDERWRWFRPCLLHSINQCTAPCNLKITPEEYARDVKRLMMVLEGRTTKLLRDMKKEMAGAAAARDYEKAGRLRDQIRAVENIDLRGDLDEHVQPEVFQIDPKKGLKGLQQVFKLPETPRVIEGVDIAHLQGGETVASLVQFIDGLPFKPGYKRYRIKTVTGADDFASMREVVSRRLRRLQQEGGRFPDILLIDGGKGQLSAVVAAMEAIGLDETNRPFTISLAKREEEVFLPGDPEPKILSRHGFGLRLLQYVRDESHRFAQHYHHILRRKSTFDEAVGSRKGGPKGRPRRKAR